MFPLFFIFLLKLATLRIQHGRQTRPQSNANLTDKNIIFQLETLPTQHPRN